MDYLVIMYYILASILTGANLIGVNLYSATLTTISSIHAMKSLSAHLIKKRFLKESYSYD